MAISTATIAAISITSIFGLTVTSIFSFFTHRLRLNHAMLLKTSGKNEKIASDLKFWLKVKESKNKNNNTEQPLLANDVLQEKNDISKTK